MRGRGDNLSALTWISWEVQVGEEEDGTETHEAQVDWVFRPDGEVDSCRIVALYDPSIDAMALYLELDGEEFMKQKGIDFAREQERAWIAAEVRDDR